MKKVIAVFLAVCLLASGCSALEEAASVLQPTEQVFMIDTYDLQLTANSNFREDTGGSFDLQITDDRSYISVMAYQYIDLPQDTTPLDVWEMQNEDLFSKRTAVTEIEAAKTQVLASKNISFALYSAENDGVKNYYATYLVDIPHAQTLAWVLVTATPSYYNSNRDTLHDIVCSLDAAQ